MLAVVSIINIFLYTKFPGKGLKAYFEPVLRETNRQQNSKHSVIPMSRNTTFSAAIAFSFFRKF